jgi:hypothetical protein
MTLRFFAERFADMPCYAIAAFHGDCFRLRDAIEIDELSTPAIRCHFFYVISIFDFHFFIFAISFIFRLYFSMPIRLRFHIIISSSLFSFDFHYAVIHIFHFQDLASDTPAFDAIPAATPAISRAAIDAIHSFAILITLRCHISASCQPKPFRQLRHILLITLFFTLSMPFAIAFSRRIFRRLSPPATFSRR